MFITDSIAGLDLRPWIGTRAGNQSFEHVYYAHYVITLDELYKKFFVSVLTIRNTVLHVKALLAQIPSFALVPSKIALPEKETLRS